MPQRVFLGTYVRGYKGKGLEEQPFPAGVVFDAVVGADMEEVIRSCFAKCYGRRACVIQALDFVAVPVPRAFTFSARVGWNVADLWICTDRERARQTDKLRWDVRLLISGPPT